MRYGKTLGLAGCKCANRPDVLSFSSGSASTYSEGIALISSGRMAGSFFLLLRLRRWRIIQ
jgi:hypothetical protein